jgi:glycosyltransferase involved in cell wall biosynthesis
MRPRSRHRRAFGLDVVGYFLSEIGLGEAARLIVGALDAADISAGLVNVPLPGRQAEAAMAGRVAQGGAHRAALSISSVTELASFARRACRGQENIHYSYWELPSVPPSWRWTFEGFDSFWAPTTFVRDMLVSVQQRPVHLVPQPIALPARPPAAPAFRGPLRILTFVDYDSFVARKNPQGAIEAFLTAFPAGSEDVELIVKARGSPGSSARAALHALMARDRRITVIDRTIARDEVAALMAGSDVFLSLHRSEGFSLGCAEAMANGKAVVATNFGGSCDFVTDATGYPVDFTRVPVSAEDYPGAEGSYWAEPSVAHAAALLRGLYDVPGQASAKAQAGYAHLEAHNSFEAVGARMRAILAG